MTTMSDEYRAIYGTTEGYVLVLQTGPYYVEESPCGKHVISRRAGLPGDYERYDLTQTMLEKLRDCFLDGLGNRASERHEEIEYFKSQIAELKWVGQAGSYTMRFTVEGRGAITVAEIPPRASISDDVRRLVAGTTFLPRADGRSVIDYQQLGIGEIVAD